MSVGVNGHNNNNNYMALSNSPVKRVPIISACNIMYTIY